VLRKLAAKLRVILRLIGHEAAFLRKVSIHGRLDILQIELGKAKAPDIAAAFDEAENDLLMA
jgi:hypothetical protein